MNTALARNVNKGFHLISLLLGWLLPVVRDLDVVVHAAECDGLDGLHGHLGEVPALVIEEPVGISRPGYALHQHATHIWLQPRNIMFNARFISSS